MSRDSLSTRRRAFVSTALDEEVHRLLWRPLFEVELQREDDPRAAMHAPKERADAILRRRVEASSVENQLPLTRRALGRTLVSLEDPRSTNGSTMARTSDRAARIATRSRG